MTRDEAITKAEEALGFKTDQTGVQSIEARKFVDVAVALGLLKLDVTEVKSVIRSAFPGGNGF